MKEPLVSVLMVNYNHEDTIKETIESVLRQTYQNIQFIIVDDGSTDRSCNIIESFHDERIELYRLAVNRHICYATNHGFEKVKGDYLARIDSDDVWYREKLSRQIDFLQKNKQYKICFSWLDLINAEGKNINENNPGLLHMYEAEFTGQEDCLLRFFLYGNCLSHSSVLMETEVMQTVGGFNPGYMQSHDFDYWVRIAKRYPLYVMKERLLAARWFDGNSKIQNNSRISHTNTLRFYNEYVDIRRHFFDNMSDDLFRRTFREEFRDKEAYSYEDLECEKAFLLCRPIPPTQVLPPSGIEKFLEIFISPDIKSVLECKYSFVEKDFYELTGTHIYNDMILQEKENSLRQQYENEVKKRNEIENELEGVRGQKKQLQQEKKQLQREKKRLEQLIRTYDNSTSWRMTAPFRWVTGKVKGKR